MPNYYSSPDAPPCPRCGEPLGELAERGHCTYSCATSDSRPTTKPVARRPGYVLYANGELWTTGRHGYRAGYVMDPENIGTAIDNAEEEARCLMAQARAEFGVPS